MSEGLKLSGSEKGQTSSVRILMGPPYFCSVKWLSNLFESQFSEFFRPSLAPAQGRHWHQAQAQGAWCQVTPGTTFFAHKWVPGAREGCLEPEKSTNRRGVRGDTKTQKRKNTKTQKHKQKKKDVQ